MSLNFLTESTKDFKETETIGSFAGSNKLNAFNAVFESAAQFMATKGIDVKADLNTLVKKPAMMSAFKDKVLGGLDLDISKPREHALFEQASQLWDNCVSDYISESAIVGQLLPFKAMDLPILIKQHLSVAAKDIMQTEVTKSPVIKKQMERRWLVDTKTNKKWEYPTCFFKDEYKEIFAAGKGLRIKDTAVSLPIFNYDIVANLSDGNPARDKITYDLEVTKVIDDLGNTITLAKPMYINMNDSRWKGGEINETVVTNATTVPPTTALVEDMIVGTVNFQTNSVSLNSCNNKIKKVIFSGYLSNELNERALTIDYTREEREWKIEDGFRMDVPYSLEELEDAKVLLDVDLYKKTYDNLTDILVHVEDNGILDWLDDDFAKYEGLELDPLGFNSFIKKTNFDCDYKTKAVGVLQSDYIKGQLKWEIDRFINALVDTCKMEDLTFVCYGNPVYVSLLSDNVNWVVKSGDMVGGVKANYSYGVMNSGSVKIQVVATNKIDSAKYKKLRFIPYPLGKEQFTFKHYKYVTHILTTANSGYKAADRPGGSMTNLMATNRCKTVSVQGIQGELEFLNVAFATAGM